MRMCGLEDITRAEVAAKLEAGGRFVFYEYCISLLVLTLRMPTPVVYVPAGDLGLVRGLPFTLISLCLGWWGIPWGIIYTPLTLVTNCSGGCDVTAEVRARFQLPSP
jgi:hypothetical protein